MSPIAKNALFAFLSSWLLLPAALNGQHTAWQNFSINEGLSSNEINHLMQDSRGFLWVATKQSICYFNGYEFQRPVDTSVMASSAAFNLWEDAQGSIWFSHPPATLWLIENDTVRPWKYNAVLGADQGKPGYVAKFVTEKDGTLWATIDKVGYVRIKPDGTREAMLDLHKTICSFTEINGKMLEVLEANPADAATEEQMLKSGRTAEIYHWQGAQAVPLGRFRLSDCGKGTSFRAWHLRNGDFLLCRLQTFYLIRDNQLIWQGQKDVFVEDVFEDSDGAILLCSIAEGVSGLLRYPSRQHFQRDEFENLLPGHEVMCFLRDREGGWWAGTRDAGIFYCKNPRLDIFDTSTGLPSSHVQRLSTDGRGTVYAGLRPFDICSIPLSGGRPKLLPRPPGKDFKELTALRFDTLTGRLWCGADLSFWENDRWKFSERPPGGLSDRPEKSISAQNIVPDPASKSWWVDYRYSFASVDRRTGLVTDYQKSKERIFSVIPDPSGSLWVTTFKGLRIWRDSAYEPPPFDHPALRYPARNLKLLPQIAGGGMVIALRGGGLLIRNQAGQFAHLTVRDGLTSDVLSDLSITPDGILYASSNAGLNILRPQPDGSWRIETLTAKHGLPSNQVNDVTWLGDEIWVATNRGIARFRGKPAPAPMPAPVLEKFSVNNRDTVFAPNLRLAHHQNNIALRFFALHFRSGGDIPYRYRLLPADTAFTYAHNRTINFSLLPPGRYVFEAQAQNEDGQWSEPSRWPFEIRPPWWATWWFRVLIAAALASAAYLFFQNRLRAIRREAAEREKIRDLEAAALRAQMNPHFIFNCLQAIQSFIAKNDGDAAATYLARFARLVRLALHGSVDGHHTLAEEIAMLENYLHLEQLRFQGKFEFAVSAPGLDANEISLPPLLVQPLVENALIHGMKNREYSGRVEVVFTQKNQMLEVSVTDNGPGFSEKEDSEKGPHRSVGMMLTQKRLDLLAGTSKTGAQHFARETVFDESGVATGARVRILIPVVVEPSFNE